MACGNQKAKPEVNSRDVVNKRRKQKWVVVSSKKIENPLIIDKRNGHKFGVLLFGTQCRFSP